MSPGYQWSWRVYGGIKLSDKDDILLSWTSMRADSKNSIAVANDSNGDSSGATPRFLFPSGWNTVGGKVDFNLDDVYGVWGHTIHFNNPWSIRFGAGLDYVNLDSDMKVGAEVFDNSSIGIQSVKADSHLNGIGPRLEFDMTYHLPYSIAVFANTNAALFVGTRKISAKSYASNPATAVPTFSFSTSHVVIPKLGLRLGASYDWIFDQVGACGSVLTVDAGWQFDSYIHAIERPALDNAFITTKTSNFGDQGVFLGAKFSMGWL
jgi:hypothetical protein